MAKGQAVSLDAAALHACPVACLHAMACGEKALGVCVLGLMSISNLMTLFMMMTLFRAGVNPFPGHS